MYCSIVCRATVMNGMRIMSNRIPLRFQFGMLCSTLIGHSCRITHAENYRKVVRQSQAYQRVNSIRGPYIPQP